ncbi:MULTISPECIES: DUF1365 domain-containing protein [unclassified Roseateles]|uniref:DUF1365 domain-containing protein n=1 Tax=unclassified Roseateles TaxID=2626991 RepID=UPI0006F8483E|nr:MULTISPECIES: DUF1365 domain-containing protein [unclassified Roseateles]KQW45767.1 hypothetical protein ASC81_12825 [Pelomonas sp. Root405]KRA72611.1 hypothetical protein ASD88_12825 [Pelomonas sp. Root662]
MGQVYHRRLRPREHAFAYPSYFLWLPMRSLRRETCAALNRNRFGWLSFHDADHGEGGSDALAWLDALLVSEGIDDADGEAWLQTYPRVLGHAFKPVSFWFCERTDSSLAAVVVEVNNTFGERHCYLLHGPDLAWGCEQTAAKVFHVSPFCRVEGRYRFRFLHGNRHVISCVDHDDDTGPLLLTSLSGRLQPLTSRSARAAFFAMPALTLMIVARIHWQALKLAIKRLPFFSKPQPPERFVTR